MILSHILKSDPGASADLAADVAGVWAEKRDNCEPDLFQMQALTNSLPKPMLFLLTQQNQFIHHGSLNALIMSRRERTVAQRSHR
jgi:hypothetical protein